MTKIVDGKEISFEIEKEIKEEIKSCIIRPSVAVTAPGTPAVSKPT